MSNRTLTILAGGYSRRFQKKDGQWLDKALLYINNEPLLIHLLDQGNEIYDGINISVNSNSRKRDYKEIVESYLPNINTDFTVDLRKISLDGVLKGIYSTLKKRAKSSIQFIPSDRPYLDLRILRGLKVMKRGVSLLKYDNGMIEPLLSLYGAQASFPESFSQLPLSRADVPIRISNEIQVYSINEILDRNNLSSKIFSNINIQPDIENEGIEHSNSAAVNIPDSVIIKREQPNFTSDDTRYNKEDGIIKTLIEIENYYSAFLSSLYFWKQKKISVGKYKALGIESLKKEYEFWIKNEIPFLALHSLDDLVGYFPKEKKPSVNAKIEHLRKKMRIEPRRIK
ncbi:MAG: NTP transferase domain-containing protein [Candidatus Heimdallarchaeota archaeon]|nr:NTP transferase domain-containing protein [Candidatus Heimdallarchaeota archaeon]MCG3256941.1 NTP transferase domain-containing protein [Candidatus Heimdallarchaeota archaeon]MCK4612004.1 NTP transferase domain-containing protein [Candidatus Heimdallarchaeota archaeon]